MCHYITATLPRDADLKRLRPIIRQHKLAFTPMDNPYVQAQLPAGTYYLLATRGYCDCGTVLGCGVRPAPAGPRESEAKLRNKGWSEAKLERWRAEKAASAERREREAEEAARQRLSEAEEWLRFIRDMLREGAGSVGLLLHWYSGRPETERIRIAAQVRVAADELTPELLLRVDEDVLYVFRP
jgi:hypothetical protein